MAVLGIEGTAHTIGVGIVERSPAGRAAVLANERAMLRPAEGGIHPREAAAHHAEAGPGLLRKALEKAGIAPAELDAVAFSRGPGLGPCLRVAATMARALAVRHERPLVGVNHCVAHLEIGRGVTDADDPLLVYASGGNTQVIAAARGRYRVFGETLDVGIGNMLDKFARDHGIPFPGGPEVERLAATAMADGRSRLHPLPYTVKGMDMGFSGTATAATRLVRDGVALDEVCYSLQETAFAALVETAERALAYTDKPDLLLGGGVACNTRLQTMARQMAQDRGVAFHCPPRDLLVDNGAMIAWLGLLQWQAGDTIPVEQSTVTPYQRTDDVDLTWRTTPANAARPGWPQQGAEATVEPAAWRGRDVVVKRRTPKAYRHPDLDDRLRAQRTRDEVHLLAQARAAGVHVPVVYDVERSTATIWMERIDAPVLDAADDAMRSLGDALGRLHAAGIVHGDPTLRNVLQGPVLIDFGLAHATHEDEPRGVDLHLVEEALAGHDDHAARWDAFMDGYRRHGPAGALGRLEQIRARGRYRD